MSFEDVMRKRLANCDAEACKEILASVKAGRSISDAVTDAIEVLPASKTRELRRWLEDWEAWEEWQKWQAKGWRVQKHGGYVFEISPEGFQLARDESNLPPLAVTIAAAGVRVASAGERDTLKYVANSTGSHALHGKYTGPPAGKRFITQFLVTKGK